MMIKAEVTGARKVVDKLHSKFLKGKAKPQLFMGYSAPYALEVHEDMTRASGAKYLEEPMRRKEKEMVRVIEDVIRADRNMVKAVKAGAEVVMEESLKVVPVLTGQLRDSHFIRVE